MIQDLFFPLLHVQLGSRADKQNLDWRGERASKWFNLNVIEIIIWSLLGRYEEEEEEEEEERGRMSLNWRKRRQ